MKHELDCPSGAGLSCDCTGIYEVLKPLCFKTGATSMTPDGLVHWNRVEFEHLGYASSMADALAKFPRNVRNGYSPVLHFIGSLQ
ncbi:MAG: hypothetical protein H7255_20725 [Ramlibacter sp.]|nr:hypothetical protein [Ramlibacter sp.]